MTVTKQQQLEWLVKECDEWPVNGEYFTMNRYAVGVCVHAHVITREEWQQERDKMSSKPEVDNSWHERGELPPVGGECEIMHRLWIKPKKVKIAAITKEYVMVVDGQCEQHYYLRDITFRPLRTEREMAIENMARIIADHGGVVDDISLGALVDAGFKMVKS